VRDFGENSNVARRVVPALYAALKSSPHPKVQVLFQQWLRQFAEITGYEKESGQLDIAGLAKSYAVPDKTHSAEHLFFALHSYYAAFIKLLAVQVAQYYLMPKLGTGLAAVANQDGEGLRRYLTRMEEGGLLAEYGIRNFLEGDFFRWYLDIWDETLDGAFRRLVGDLGNYSLVTLDVDPEETRDLLKQLYQNLMPRKLRHALGEYYTPDWLAERVLNQLNYRGDPAKRLLDPACGSGTFLVLAIRRVRDYARERMLPEATVLGQILDNIVGFDLNPLAVISARTNYLLALGDLLAYRRGDINIPVYLCDSILTPSQGGDLFSHNSYSLNTAIGRFTVPRALVTARHIETFAQLLEDAVNSGNTSTVFAERLRRTWSDLSADQATIASQLFARLTELDRQDINGIWARIIKNAFAPLFQGRFDMVAGNPPWVNWANLPEAYRQESSPLWERYCLFPHRGMEARLGGAMDDISVLMTYVALDRYLGPDGRLGFVITQSVFKTSGGGKGFRQFQLGENDPIAVLHVDDMSALQPFQAASNQTAVFVAAKGRKTQYPVPYTYWRKKPKETLTERDDLDQIIAKTQRRNWIALPVLLDDRTSQWLTGRRMALSGVRKIVGASQYTARAGVHGWRSAIFWVQAVGERPDGLLMVANVTEGAKKKVEAIQTAIETGLLYPLLRQKDCMKWYASPSIEMIIPQDRGNMSKGLPEKVMQTDYPRTYAYLKQFERAARSSRLSEVSRAQWKPILRDLQCWPLYTGRVQGRMAEHCVPH